MLKFNDKLLKNKLKQLEKEIKKLNYEKHKIFVQKQKSDNMAYRKSKELFELKKKLD